VARHRNYCVSPVGVEVGGFDGSTIIGPLSPPETTPSPIIETDPSPPSGSWEEEHEVQVGQLDVRRSLAAALLCLRQNHARKQKRFRSVDLMRVRAFSHPRRSFHRRLSSKLPRLLRPDR
jgi:hypothetical protein